MENNINHDNTIIDDTEDVGPAGTALAETHDTEPAKVRDAGFVVTEGLAYAVLFIGVMAAAATAFTGLGQVVADQVQTLLGI